MIGFLKRGAPPAFGDWIWDSRRPLAIKGKDEHFRRDMVAAYSAMAKRMPDNGLQVVMFTHQDAGVWADLGTISRLAGYGVRWCGAAIRAAGASSRTRKPCSSRFPRTLAGTPTGRRSNSGSRSANTKVASADFLRLRGVPMLFTEQMQVPEASVDFGRYRARKSRWQNAN